MNVSVRTVQRDLKSIEKNPAIIRVAFNTQYT
ncbi:hypothetical protein RCO48_23900 [Peribacillus frigoritolerans]|nr:hypothetical protein [Peribacillus frigoritolerans]